MTGTDTRAGKAACVGSLVTILIGLGVLYCWLFDIGILRTYHPGFVVMNPVTAIIFIFSGTSLGLALIASGRKGKSQALIMTSRLCAVVVMTVAVIKVAGYIAGADLPFDRVLFRSELSFPGLPPNHMAPTTAFNFLLLGSSLLLVNSNNRIVRFIVEFCIGIIGLGALIAIMGYVYHVLSFYEFRKLAPMSISAAITFMVMVVAFFLADTDRGLPAVLVGNNSGGIMARRLLPAVVLLPTALGWLELQGEKGGIFESSFGNALFGVGYILVFAVLVCWSAWRLYCADLERAKSDKALQWQAALLEAQLNSSIDGVLVVDDQNRKILQNHRMADLFKIPRDIAEDKDDQRQLQWVASVVKDSPQFMKKVLYLNAHPEEVSQDELALQNGTTLERYSSRVVGKDETYFGRIWTFRDITKRKEAEESLRLLNSAVLQSKESILITDAELDLPGPRIIFVNPAFTAMTGYSREEALGKTPRILQGPDTDKEILARLRKNLENGEMFAGETINYRKDGTPFELEWQIAPLRDAGGKVTHFVALQRDITERRKAERQALLNEQRYRSLVEATASIVWNTPASGEFQVEQHGWTDFTGQSFEELRGWGWLNAVHPDDQAETKRVWAAAIDNRSVYEVEHRLRDRNGVYQEMMIRAVPLLSPEGIVVQWIGIHQDISVRKRMEARLFQSQKLETVGKLAGGIAHEFNSILTAIIGQSELLLGDLPEESPLVKNAAEINKAAVRAANLTRQLLAYGRKQIMEPEVLDLGRVLAGMEGALRHLMGQDVDIQISPAIEAKTVRVDAGQIEQVVVNMALNARDAMPNGGKLTLETANISFNEETVGRNPELKPGNYVMLAISDTGTGMKPEVQARVFEPFFSTRDVGHGTGLGLSTCYGIIKQSGGHISVYSEPARGTTFKIYLPQVDQPLRPPVATRDSETLPHGTETILLVEDDPALREMAADLLGRLGYKVLTAANGIEALGLKQQKDIGHIDLLFTDVVMPHMNGKELAERVRASSPHTRILFSSAYTENAIVNQGILDAGVTLLQKPFAPSALAKKVRDSLDRVPVPSL